jgi:hypothetical protein
MSDVRWVRRSKRESTPTDFYSVCLVGVLCLSCLGLASGLGLELRLGLGLGLKYG